MSIDMSSLAITAAEMVESLADEFADKDVTLGTVAVVVELNETLPDGDEATGVHYRCSDARRWVQAGFFHAAEHAVYASNEEA